MSTEPFPFELCPNPVKEFVSLLQPTTESPDEFLVAGALNVGSILAGKWILLDGQPLNNYYLLVGPTGVSKKSTAIKLAKNLLDSVKEKSTNSLFQNQSNEEIQGPSTAYPLVTHFSIEGLQTHAIGSGTSAGLMIGEYSSILDIGKRQSQQNTITELTDMYDGGAISVNTVSRSMNANRYSLNILGASTNDWLNSFRSERNIGGGFVNRHLIFTGNPVRIIPSPPIVDQKGYQIVVDQFYELIPRDLRGSIDSKRISWEATLKNIQWSHSAKVIWERFYTNRTKEIRCLESAKLKDLAARELIHASKLTGLCAALEGRGQVSIQDVEFGCRLARYSIQNAIRLMVEDRPHLDRDCERILSKLEDKGPLNKRALAQALGGKQDKINRALEYLKYLGFIEEKEGLGFERCDPTSNIQLGETEKYFGKLDACEFSTETMLNVDLMIGAEID